MKKIFIILTVLSLLVSCTRTPAAGGSSPESAVASESVKGEKVASLTSSKATEFNKKYGYYDYYGRNEMFAETVFPSKTYKPSQLPDDGIIANTAVMAEDNEFIDAVIVEQKISMSQNKWDPSVNDFYINFHFDVVGKNGHVIDYGSYTKKLVDSSSIKPVTSISLAVTEAINMGKLYDYNEVPYGDYTVYYQIMVEGEPVYTDDARGTSINCENYGEYEDEENHRPYFFDTVKLNRSGRLAFVHDDMDDYYKPTGKTYTRYIYVRVFTETVTQRREEWEYTATEKGYELVDALFRMMLLDDVYNSEEFRLIRSNLKDQDVGSVIDIFYNSVDMIGILNELQDFFKYATSNFWQFVDFDKVSEYCYRDSPDYPATEEELNEVYSAENKMSIGYTYV